MQEIVLVLSSLVGVATAAAIRKMPRDKNQLLSLGASSQIKSQISSLKIEKDILEKTISRLYQADSEFSNIQKGKLLLRYQHQYGVILARLEKLDEASKHPDLGPVGDGLITLMDQKLSNLHDRMSDMSSKMALLNTEEPKQKSDPIQKTKSKDTLNFDVKPPEARPTTSRPAKSFEMITLTSGRTTEPSFSQPEAPAKLMPKPRVYEPLKDAKPKPEDKPGIVALVPNADITPQTSKQATLSEPKPIDPENDDSEDEEDLGKITEDINKVLAKLGQAEVE